MDACRRCLGSFFDSEPRRLTERGSAVACLRGACDVDERRSLGEERGWRLAFRILSSSRTHSLGEMNACKPPGFTRGRRLDRWSGCTIDPEGVVDTGPLGQHEAARAQQPSAWRTPLLARKGWRALGGRSGRCALAVVQHDVADARRIACRLQALRERQRPPGGRP